jgi:formamidopyrimidine-DNA glycosylase
MPELPEVETVVRGLRPVMEGHRFASVEARRPDLRFPIPQDLSARLTGKMVMRVERRAKYILIHMQPDDDRGGGDSDVMIAHLGMSGRIYIDEQRPETLLAHDHLIFELETGTVLRYHDPRRFGFVDLTRASLLADHRMLKNLGPEPLGNDFNGPYLASALKGRRTPIKAALLDQKTVAGLGNIYISEALYFSGISPKRQAHSVSGGRSEKLTSAIRAVLVRAVDAGGSSLRDYVQPNGELGYFQHQWAVYGKEGDACPDCDCNIAETGGIQRITQSNRSTFYCPRRQR